jgi:hypothetical protein
MDREPLAGCAEVGGGPERVAHDEHATVDECCDFAPAGDPHNREYRRNAVAGYDVQRNSQPGGDRGAVARMAIEELDDRRRLAELEDALV